MAVAEDQAQAQSTGAGNNETVAESQAPRKIGRRSKRHEARPEPLASIELVIRKPHWEDFWGGLRSVVTVLEALFFGVVIVLAVAVYWLR